ncbi:MAG: DUF1207 domain-containing protein [Chlamydiota bacterium]
MMNIKLMKLLLAAALWPAFSFAADTDDLEQSAKSAFERQGGVSSQYLEGYLQAALDVEYHEYDVVAKVKDGNVELMNLPSDQAAAEKITSYVADFPGVEDVKVNRDVVVQDKEVAVKDKEVVVQDKEVAVKDKPKKSQLQGTWLPQSSVLFRPLVANPRKVTNSVAWRWNDDVLGKNIFAMSLGGLIPFYRWEDVRIGKFSGDLQLSLEPGVWGVFDLDKHSFPLINADYFVGAVAEYAVNSWSYRARFYHTSCHLGDEYILEVNPSVDRKNVSFEAIDFYASYNLMEALRFYGGVGYIVHSDNDYHIHPLYLEYGTEVRLFGYQSHYLKLDFQPFLAIHLRNDEDHHWNLDATYALGYEFSKLSEVGRKMRLYLEYHDGYSKEGQFSRVPTTYLAAKFAYGF